MDFELSRDINLQTEVQHQIEILGLKKQALPVWKIWVLGTLSGLWMSIAATFANMAASSIGDGVTKYVPVAPKFVVSIFAPVAMYFIVVFGGEFYSGNCMFLSVGWFKGKLTTIQVLINWIQCFLANSLGCIIGIWMFASLTELFQDEDQIEFLKRNAEAKQHVGMWLSFIRGIPANLMICTSIQMGISARDMQGKLIVLHFPLMMYTVCGFEHALTNMVVVPLGIAYGAQVNIGSWLLTNIIPAAIGNAIGGGLIIGGVETLLFNWDKGEGNTNEVQHTHSVEKSMLKYNPFSRIRVPTVDKGARNAEQLLSVRASLADTLRKIEEVEQQLLDVELTDEMVNIDSEAVEAAKSELRRRRGGAPSSSSMEPPSTLRSSLHHSQSGAASNSEGARGDVAVTVREQ